MHRVDIDHERDTMEQPPSPAAEQSQLERRKGTLASKVGNVLLTLSLGLHIKCLLIFYVYKYVPPLSYESL